MTFIDFFAGIGGFRRGLELAGHKCVGFCEYDKFATASYTSMHLITENQREYLLTLTLKQRQKEILKDEYRNGEWYANDIRTVNARNLPTADCWCFGAPCQDFSVAGERAGMDGDRSSLVREVFRILEEQKEQDRPEWLIYENVKGMLSSNKGLDYLSILSEMDRLGYDIEWQNINSKWFVSQNRERIYTIGHLRRYGARKVLPVTGADGENSVRQIGGIEAKRKNPNRYRVYDSEGISPTLHSMQGGGLEPHIVEPCFIDLCKGNLKITENARCLKARYVAGVTNRSGENSGVCIPALTPDRVNKRQNGRRFKDNGEPAFTLTSQDRHGVAIKIKEATKKGYTEAHEGDSINFSVPGSKTRRGRVDKGVAQTLDTACNQGVFCKVPDKFNVYAIWCEKYQCYIAIRKLTPKECFRLQGWTDDYFEKAAFVNSDNQLYKQAGNGVTVPVVRAIGERMEDEI